MAYLKTGQYLPPRQCSDELTGFIDHCANYGKLHASLKGNGRNLRIWQDFT